MVGNGLYVSAPPYSHARENCCLCIGVTTFCCYGPVALCVGADLCYCCCWTDKVAIESARQRQQKLDQKINQECENILNNHLK
jgi:hypothetical protein